MRSYILRLIPAAFRPPTPILPNVDNATYNAQRDPVTVLRSMSRVVQIGPYKFSLYADDWPSIKEAETAASRAAELLAIWNPAFQKEPAQNVTGILDDLADRIQAELAIDTARPFGCSLIVEPV